MIAGVVTNGEARLRLRVRGPNGRESVINALIDAGYSGWLSLSSTMVRELGLPWLSLDRGILADGTESLFDVYEATVIWDRRARLLKIDQAGTEPLVGMSLLAGYELRMQIRQRGKVTIKRLA